jgi:hypothetical protein
MTALRQAADGSVPAIRVISPGRPVLPIRTSHRRTPEIVVLNESAYTWRRQVTDLPQHAFPGR